MGNQQELQEKLEQLRVVFRSQLPAKRHDLENLFHRIKQTPDDDQALFEFYRCVHSLAGSGSLYGYPEISGKARQLELFLQTYAENRQALDAAALQQSEALFTELETLLNSV